MPDAHLLEAYARTQDQSSFAEWVRGHIDLVYSAARRQAGGDHHRAQEITQKVFLTVARKAATLARHPVIVAWLHHHTRLVAANLRKSDQRRLARETRAAADPALAAETSVSADSSVTDWTRVEPVLDDALATLAERDREAVLLRYFSGQAYADIGRQLGLAENTARMRTERALEKLRRALAKRGVTSTTAALSLALGANAVTAAPASVAASALSAVLATSAALTAASTVSTFLTMSLLKHAATGLACATLAGLAVYHFTTDSAQTPTVTAPGSLHISAPATPPPAPAELTQLAAENAALRARLATAEAERDAREKALSSTREKLAELRRPMENDMASSALRASVQPGETLVTGGYRMSDGRRLFSFVQPEIGTNGSVRFVNRITALTETAAAAVGLASLTTDAANTVQHGEVWAPGEMARVLRDLSKTEGSDVITSPNIVTLSGHQAIMTIGQQDGEQISLRLTPTLGADQKQLELELRLESLPAPSSAPDSKAK
jgi:RNA polymerase sigma factor (sigma-70 family)